jgi:hypothetical protein
LEVCPQLAAGRRRLRRQRAQRVSRAPGRGRRRIALARPHVGALRDPGLAPRAGPTTHRLDPCAGQDPRPRVGCSASRRPWCTRSPCSPKSRRSG